MKAQMDISKYRFVANISTSSKVFVDKKRKSQSRQHLNNKKTWEV